MASSAVWARRLKEIDDLLNAGDVVSAERRLRDLTQRPGARRHALRIARFWRWVKRPAQGLRVLSGKLPEGLDPGEVRLERASSLIMLGAAREALRLLDGLPVSRYPLAARQRYLAWDRLWESDRAIPDLRAYLATRGVSEEQKIVATMEIADAYTFGKGDPDTAWRLLRSLEKRVARGRHDPWIPQMLVHLQMQACAFRRDWKGLEARIARLRRQFRVDERDPWVGREARMWEIFSEAWRAGRRATRSQREEVTRVRADFEAMGRWELARVAEAHLGVAARDHDLVRAAYFGTPLAAFRRRLLDWAGMTAAEMGDSHEWPAHASRRIDPERGWADRRDGTPARLKPGQLPARLLQAIACDAFRPPTAVELHERAFPGVPFDPRASAMRLHRGIARLRTWLSGPAGGAARLEERGGRYRLVPAAGVAVVRGAPTEPGSRPAKRGAAAARVAVQAAHERWGGKLFSPADARALWATSDRTARRLLSEAERAGWVEGQGRGPARRYRVSTP